MTPDARSLQYVTDGPELFRSKSGALLMLWASYMKNDLGRNGYVQTILGRRLSSLTIITGAKEQIHHDCNALAQGVPSECGSQSSR